MLIFFLLKTSGLRTAYLYFLLVSHCPLTNKFLATALNIYHTQDSIFKHVIFDIGFEYNSSRPAFAVGSFH